MRPARSRGHPARRGPAAAHVPRLARSSHWSAIGGDADGWLAFLEPWATFDRSLAAITQARSGNPPPIAVRIDLTLADGPPSLGERGRLRCCPSDLTAVFRRLLAYPVEHVLIRLTSTDPCRSRRGAPAVGDTRDLTVQVLHQRTPWMTSCEA